MRNQEDSFVENVEKIENQNFSISFEKIVLIIGVQILAQLEDELERRVILSSGIKGEPPLLSSCTLTELLTGIPIQETLQRLEQKLPEIIETARNRKKIKQEVQSISNHITTPQSMSENSVERSTQISFF
ncbi:hypothetical protein NIES2119_23990 [[Phormidium ambiguum] IAM M-71]|uniref:Uncharacterized protein n=1 Tax=[Phormidium ambiguum] IAM M-71 TaxID=454136 RepID=A0A1U7I9K2_9CYAN|nr:hypothetical protein [Phormidium ambiguum]OKH33129.1 hypothetical protein NIES2119_23990 [Phormidium ambiguum IAM M-71]